MAKDTSNKGKGNEWMNNFLRGKKVPVIKIERVSGVSSLEKPIIVQSEQLKYLIGGIEWPYKIQTGFGPKPMITFNPVKGQYEGIPVRVEGKTDWIGGNGVYRIEHIVTYMTAPPKEERGPNNDDLSRLMEEKKITPANLIVNFNFKGYTLSVDLDKDLLEKIKEAEIQERTDNKIYKIDDIELQKGMESRTWFPGKYDVGVALLLKALEHNIKKYSLTTPHRVLDGPR